MSCIARILLPCSRYKTLQTQCPRVLSRLHKIWSPTRAPIDYTDYLGLKERPSTSNPYHNELWTLERLRKTCAIRHRCIPIGGAFNGSSKKLEDVCKIADFRKGRDGLAGIGNLWSSKDPYHVAQVVQALFQHPICSKIPPLRQSPITRSLTRPSVDHTCHMITDRSSVESDHELYFKVHRGTNGGVNGGVTCVQHRRSEKESQRDFFRTSFHLQQMLFPLNIPLIINDHIDIALAVGACGVHIGQNDLPYREARRLLGERAIIGLTVNTMDNLLEAENFDVDYLGLQVFPSTTKPHHGELWTPERLREARAISRHRFVLLGGMFNGPSKEVEEVCNIINLGKEKDGLAGIGKLWRSKDPCHVAQGIHTLVQHSIRLKRGGTW